MIKGLGIDVVEIDRIRRAIARFGVHFSKRILTEYEYGRMPAVSDSYTAARFAAKEAAVKALGTGFSNGIGMQHIEIQNSASGAPNIQFFGPALERMNALGARKAHVSLTHGRDTAAAVVILED